MNKTIIKIDASALKNSTCSLRFYRTVVEGLRKQGAYNDIVYGSAFHKFVSEMYLTSGNVAEAMAACMNVFRVPCIIRKKHLTEKHLVKTCLDYWEHFRESDNFEVLVVNGKPLVEVTFEITILETETHIFKLVGTIDKIGQFKRGCFGIGDYKTTSSWNADDYFQKYRISTQLLTYFWAAKQLALRNPDSPLAEIFKTQVGCFIDGIFVGTSGTSFKRSDIFFFGDEIMKEYTDLLYRKIMRSLVDFIEAKACPAREGIIQGSCVEQQFVCDFYEVCAAPDEIAANHILRNNFITKPYDPFKFNE